MKGNLPAESIVKSFTLQKKIQPKNALEIWFFLTLILLTAEIRSCLLDIFLAVYLCLAYWNSTFKVVGEAWY